MKMGTVISDCQKRECGGRRVVEGPDEFCPLDLAESAEVHF